MQKACIESVPAKWSFGKLPTEIIENPDLTTHEKLLIGCLLWHGPGQVFPGRERLASLMSCSVHQVTRAIKGIESKGIIKVSRQKGGVNVYDMGGGVVPDRNRGSSPQALGVVPDRNTNESNLNESKEQEKNCVAIATPTKPRLDSPPKDPTLKNLIRDWYDTFEAVRGFKSTEPGGYVAGVLKRLISQRTEPVLRWEIGNYWDWIDNHKVHIGDLKDFMRKENMHHDMYLERHKRRD